MLRIGPIDWYNAMYLLVFIAWLIKDNPKWLYSELNRYFIFFILILMFSYLRGFLGPYPPDPIEALTHLKAIVTELFLFFVFFNFIQSKKQIKMIVYGLLVVMVYEAFVVIGQYITAVSELGDSNFSWNLKSRITGTFFVGTGIWNDVNETTASANEVGSFFSLYTLFMIGIALCTDNKKLKFSLFGLSLFFLAPMLMSFSRGSWLGFAFAIVMYSLRKNKKLLIGFIVVVLLLLQVLPSSIVDRGGSIEDESAQGRLGLWGEAISAMTNPAYFVFGIGFLQASSYIGMDAHNAYIRVMIESGVPGLLLLLLLFYFIWKNLNFIFNKIHDPLLKGFVLGCILAFFSFVVLNLVGTRMFNGAVSATLWAFIGIAMKIYYIDENSEYYNESVDSISSS